MQRRLLGFICVLVAGITLSLGLWPFQPPRNDVGWMKHSHGLVFGRYGTAFTATPLDASVSANAAGGSIEIWVLPDRRDSSTILSLYRPDLGLSLKLRQSLTDLEIVTEQSAPSGTPVVHRLYQDSAFRGAIAVKEPRLITVTAGDRGTVVYADGAALRTTPHFHISPDFFGGRIVLGEVEH